MVVTGVIHAGTVEAIGCQEVFPLLEPGLFAKFQEKYPAIYLFISESLHRVEPCGFQGRIEARGDADRQGHQDGEEDRPAGYYGSPPG